MSGMRNLMCDSLAGEEDTAFTGYHRLERALYRDNVTSPDAVLTLSNQTLAEWAAELATQYTALGTRIAQVRDIYSNVQRSCRSFQ